MKNFVALIIGASMLFGSFATTITPATSVEAAETQSYKGISPSFWAYEEIETLHKDSVFEGVRSSYFKPNHL